MTEQEAIEIGKNKLLPCLEGVYWKGQKEHPEKTELIQALQHLLQIAERAGDVEEIEKSALSQLRTLLVGKLKELTIDGHKINFAEDNYYAGQMDMLADCIAVIEKELK